MSGAGLVQQITEVLREHSSLDDDEWDCCECGAPTERNWPRHVSEVLVARLNLHEERQVHYPRSPIESDTEYVRWVSDWEPNHLSVHGEKP
jgi:hypothetical protein